MQSEELGVLERRTKKVKRPTPRLSQVCVNGGNHNLPAQTLKITGMWCGRCGIRLR